MQSENLADRYRNKKDTNFYLDMPIAHLLLISNGVEKVYKRAENYRSPSLRVFCSCTLSRPIYARSPSRKRRLIRGLKSDEKAWNARPAASYYLRKNVND